MCNGGKASKRTASSTLSPKIQKSEENTLIRSIDHTRQDLAATVLR